MHQGLMQGFLESIQMEGIESSISPPLITIADEVDDSACIIADFMMPLLSSSESYLAIVQKCGSREEIMRSLTASGAGQDTGKYVREG